MQLSNIKLEKLSFDFKSVVIIVTILSAWFDLKTDNKVRDYEHKDFEKRISKLEGYHEPRPIAMLTSHNKVATLPERVQKREKHYWQK